MRLFVFVPAIRWPVQPQQEQSLDDVPEVPDVAVLKALPFGECLYPIR